MKSVKSFRIDDLLTDNNERCETGPALKISSGKCNDFIDKKSTLCIEDTSNSSSTSGESTCSSTMSKDKVEIKREATLPGDKNGFAGHRETIPKTEFRGMGLNTAAIPAYHPSLPAVSHPYGYEGHPKGIPYYLPYPLESYKLNQHSHVVLPPAHSAAHHHGAPLPLPMLSALQAGYLPPRPDLAAYHHGMMGHLAQKQIGIGNGFLDKRQFIHERVPYPLFSLNRSLYSATCKRKGGQIRFNNAQTAQLEKAFVQQKYLNAHDRKKLAHSLGLSDRQVKTWFQNRRAKLRKCKSGSGGETEESESVSPQDLRTVRLMPYEHNRFNHPSGGKN